MNRRLSIATVFVALVLSPITHGAGLDALSSKDSVAGLKAALDQGATRAVASLGATDGFLGNPKVKIPLPPALKKGEKAFKLLGLNDEAEDLVTAMNRAAEAAVPQAKTLLVDSVRQMSVDDARQILTGGDEAATQFFKRSSYDKLAALFLPIVRQTTAKTNVAQQYNEFAGQAAKYGLLDAKDAKVEEYVTRKALDGLFVMIAEEERVIRKDPLGQSSKILKNVFGAIGK